MPELSDEQLERLVSETIEPMPAKVPLFKTQVSELRAWVAYGEEGEWLGDGWQPAPWLTDDRYTMRLFDKMPDGNLSKHTFNLRTEYRCDPYGDGELGYAQFDKDRRRAIVLASLKWQGKI